MSMQTNDSQVQNDNGNNGNDDAGSQNENADIRNLREKAKSADTLKTENEGLKQQLALHNAGLNLSDKQIKALNAAHEGESNPEEWRKTAEELGFVEAPKDASTEEQQAHQQVANAAAGSTTQKELPAAEAYAQAKNPQEVLQMVRERGGVVMDDIE